MELNFLLGVESEAFTDDRQVIRVYPRLLNEENTPVAGRVVLSVENTEFEIDTISNKLTDFTIPKQYWGDKLQQSFVLCGKLIDTNNEVVEESRIEVEYQSPAIYRRNELLKTVRGETYLYYVVESLLWTTLATYYNKEEGSYKDLFGINLLNNELRFGVDLNNVSFNVIHSKGGDDFTTIAETFIGKDRANKIINEGLDLPSSVISNLVNRLINTEIGKLLLTQDFEEAMVSHPVTSDYNYHYTFLKNLAKSTTKYIELPLAFKKLHKASS